MDEQFLSAPPERNMPVMMALLGVWYRNFWNAQSCAGLPYAQSTFFVDESKDRQAILDAYDAVVLTDADARRLAQLGRHAVPVLGNLKFDVVGEPALEERGHRWRSAWLARSMGGLPRFCIVAASTREGEEALLLDAWAQQLQPPALASRFPPLLIIVPRHPQRFDEVAALIEARGWKMARRSRLADDESLDVQVLLGDSMGEMAAWYALADVAIIGGSLLPFGGQNLIEACAAGVPVIVGPHTFNFSEVAEQAIAADAALRVSDASRAVSEALTIVLDAEQRQSMSDRALAFGGRHRGATVRTMQVLAPYLDRQPTPA